MQIFTNQRIAIRPQSNSRLLEKAPCKKAPKSPRRQHAFRSESLGSASRHDEPCADKKSQRSGQNFPRDFWLEHSQKCKKIELLDFLGKNLAPWPRSLDFNWRRASASAPLSVLRSPSRRSPSSAMCAVCFLGGVYDYQACSESFKMDEKLWTTNSLYPCRSSRSGVHWDQSSILTCPTPLRSSDSHCDWDCSPRLAPWPLRSECANPHRTNVSKRSQHMKQPSLTFPGKIRRMLALTQGNLLFSARKT